MKVGDKLYCYCNVFSNNELYFKKDNYYEIISISDNKVSIRSYRGTISLVFFINSTDKRTWYKSYFYTEQDIRKEKINKINDKTIS